MIADVETGALTRRGAWNIIVAAVEESMPATEVVFYQEEDGDIPVLDWLKELQRTNRPAFDKCLFLIGLLEQFGHELRRPRVDFLRDGVYELRTEVRNVNYRLLYGLARMWPYWHMP